MSEKIIDSAGVGGAAIATLMIDAGLIAPVEGSGESVLLPRGTALWRRLRQGMDEMALVAGYEGYVFPESRDNGNAATSGDRRGFEPFSPSSVTAVHVATGARAVHASVWREALQDPADPSVLAQHHAYTLRGSGADAEEDAYTLLDLQRRYFEELLAIPAIAGVLPANQRGDRSTAYGLDGIAKNGGALRLAESGVLTGPGEYAVQHAAVTRHLIAALLLAHLSEGKPVFPPRLAPEQAVILPLLPSKRRLELTKLAHQIRSGLRNEIRVALDEGPSSTTEEKQELWASRGVPIQILVGEEDLEHRQVALIRRDTLEREVISVSFLADRVKLMLTEIQDNLLEKALEAREGMLLEPESLDELSSALEAGPGYALAPWDGSEESAKRIREKTGCAVRLHPFGSEAEAIGRNCIASGREARYVAILARPHSL